MMMVDKGEHYDRAAARNERRTVENAGEREPEEWLGADDPVAKATYADPKARHYALVDGDNDVLAEKREIAANGSSHVDGVTNAQLADEDRGGGPYDARLIGDRDDTAPAEGDEIHRETPHMRALAGHDDEADKPQKDEGAGKRKVSEPAPEEGRRYDHDHPRANPKPEAKTQDKRKAEDADPPVKAAADKAAKTKA